MKVHGDPEVLSRIRAGETVQGYATVIDVADPLMRKAEISVVPWEEAPENETNLEAVDVPPDVVERMRSGLPERRPISHQERYRMIVDSLRTYALASHKVFGYVVWPQSLKRELQAIGWRSGDPDFEKEVEALASRFIVQAANQQKEEDAHKVVLDHRGHLSA